MPNQLNLIVNKPINCEPVKASAKSIVNYSPHYKKSLIINTLKLSQDFDVFMLASGSHYSNNKPFKSNTAFAPMCSTRRSQLLPK